MRSLWVAFCGVICPLTVLSPGSVFAQSPSSETSGALRVPRSDIIGASRPVVDRRNLEERAARGDVAAALSLVEDLIEGGGGSRDLSLAESWLARLANRLNAEQRRQADILRLRLALAQARAQSLGGIVGVRPPFSRPSPSELMAIIADQTYEPVNLRLRQGENPIELRQFRDAIIEQWPQLLTGTGFDLRPVRRQEGGVAFEAVMTGLKNRRAAQAVCGLLDMLVCEIEPFRGSTSVGRPHVSANSAPVRGVSSDGAAISRNDAILAAQRRMASVQTGLMAVFPGEQGPMDNEVRLEAEAKPTSEGRDSVHESGRNIPNVRRQENQGSDGGQNVSASDIRRQLQEAEVRLFDALVNIRGVMGDRFALPALPDRDLSSLVRNELLKMEEELEGIEKGVKEAELLVQLSAEREARAQERARLSAEREEEARVVATREAEEASRLGRQVAELESRLEMIKAAERLAEASLEEAFNRLSRAEEAFNIALLNLLRAKEEEDVFSFVAAENGQRLIQARQRLLAEARRVVLADMEIERDYMSAMRRARDAEKELTTLEMMAEEAAQNGALNRVDELREQVRLWANRREEALLEARSAESRRGQLVEEYFRAIEALEREVLVARERDPAEEARRLEENRKMAESGVAEAETRLVEAKDRMVKANEDVRQMAGARELATEALVALRRRAQNAEFSREATQEFVRAAEWARRAAEIALDEANYESARQILEDQKRLHERMAARVALLRNSLIALNDAEDVARRAFDAARAEIARRGEEVRQRARVHIAKDLERVEEQRRLVEETERAMAALIAAQRAAPEFLKTQFSAAIETTREALNVSLERLALMEMVLANKEAFVYDLALQAQQEMENELAGQMRAIETVQQRVFTPEGGLLASGERIREGVMGEGVPRLPSRSLLRLPLSREAVDISLSSSRLESVILPRPSDIWAPGRGSSSRELVMSSGGEEVRQQQNAIEQETGGGTLFAGREEILSPASRSTIDQYAPPRLEDSRGEGERGDENRPSAPESQPKNAAENNVVATRPTSSAFGSSAEFAGVAPSASQQAPQAPRRQVSDRPRTEAQRSASSAQTPNALQAGHGQIVQSQPVQTAGGGSARQSHAAVQVSSPSRQISDGRGTPGEGAAPTEIVVTSPVSPERVVRVRPLRTTEEVASAEERAAEMQARAREAARLAEEARRSGAGRSAQNSPAQASERASPSAMGDVSRAATEQESPPVRPVLRPIEMRLPPEFAAQLPAFRQAAERAGGASSAQVSPLLPAASARYSASEVSRGNQIHVHLGSVSSAGEARNILSRARSALPAEESSVQLMAEPEGAGFRVVARGFSHLQTAQNMCAQLANRGIVCTIRQ